MNKIGILTFCNANNYGALLQAFAMQEYLSKAESVELINLSFNSKLKLGSNISIAKKGIHRRILDKIRREKIEEYRKKYLKISSTRINGDSQIRKKDLEYDCYIVGSDQVWNTDITNQTKAFFLDFINSKNKIAYAASYGKKDLNTLEKKWTYEELNKFSAISVREKESSQYINEEFNLNSKVVCDPVFLLKQEEWIKKLNLKNKPQKKYILVYYMEASEQIKNVIDSAKLKYKIPVFALCGGTQRLKGIKHLECVGVEGFVQKIMNASLIITNSFHASAFSMIFKRKFIVVEHSKWNIRLDNLLQLANCSSKLVRNNTENSKHTISEVEIDGEKAYKRFIPFIEKSESFLKTAMKEIKK